MEQLGSAGAIAAYLFTSETDCNKRLSYFYNKLNSEESDKPLVAPVPFQ